MNFQDLLAKMKELDESMAVMAPPSEPQFDNGGAGASDECTGMPSKAGGPGLAGDDEVLTGECGCGGDKELQGGPQVSIRSLIAALQAIEQGSGHEHGADIELFGMDETQPDGGFGDATTEPDPETANIAAMTRTGNDLASKGKEAVKMNGGGNPMQESLARKLAAHYESLKAR